MAFVGVEINIHDIAFKIIFGLPRLVTFEILVYYLVVGCERCTYVFFLNHSQFYTVSQLIRILFGVVLSVFQVTRAQGASELCENFVRIWHI